MRVRAIVALAAAAVAALFFAPAATAAGYPPAICPTLSVSTTHPLPGEQITVSGSDFEANASVRLELHTKVYVLATVTTDSTGAFSVQVTLPSGVTGTHAIVAVSGVPDVAGCPVPSVTLHIQGHGLQGSSASGGGHNGGTSFTGLDLLILLIVAAALIGVGVAFNRGGKRRHAYEGEPLV